MKRILLAITAIIALAACNKDIIVPEIVTDNENVVLDFSVVVPEAQTVTKAFSDTPVIGGLKVIVFDQNSLLLKAVDATIADNAETTDRVEFTVTLPQHPSACSVHFVANCPATTNIMSEADMTSLVTSGTQDAYWQRIPVDNLIASNATLKAQLEAKFTKIPLIRNFAKVSVVANNVTGFNLQGYTLINVPTSGTVVPYNTGAGVFESYHNNGTGLGYTALKANGYNGFMPVGVSYNTAIPETVTNMAPLYTYESRLREEDNTALIVYGTYNGTAGYYKVDFVSPSNTYNNGNYEILRNIHYVVTINSVLGAGYPTAAAAAAAAAGNNISASTDTQNLLNISDGTSRLFVDEIAKHIVNSQSFTVKFRYEPTINGTPNNTGATISRSKADTDADAVISGTPVVAESDVDGWRTITITPKSVPTAVGTVYTEDLTIKIGNLSRTVKLYLHKPYAMSVECTPTTASAVKTEVTVNTTIPAGLPQEIFPLVFDIEDKQLCLSPDASKTNIQGSVPVTTEPSIIDTSKETFHYKRTLTWDQYSALAAGADGKTFPTYFVTNKVVSEVIEVYVYHELFGTDSNVNPNN